MLDVTILSTEQLLFKGQAEHVAFPGELGVFEIWSFHRPLVSRLVPGLVVVDDRPLAIRGGVVSVGHNVVTALVNPDPHPPS